MKILHSDLKKGEIKIKIENADDVLSLKGVVSAGDFVSGHCERKIKVGKGENTKTAKKRYFLEILVEKTEFHNTELRVNGKTTEEKEDIPKGSYQTIEIIPSAEVKIKKEKWSTYSLKKIKDATFESKQKILIVVFDRENSLFATTKKGGFDVLFELEGDVQKKAYETKKESKFFQQIIDKIKDSVERYKITNVILASPAFWKDELVKLIKEKKLRDILISVGCSSVTENAIYEVLKSSAVEKILEQERAAKEIGLVENVMMEISKNGAAAYGLDHVAEAIEMGNVKILLLTDRFFSEKQQTEQATYVEEIIDKADKVKAEIHIISSGHEGGQKLDGLGGIAALLRYKSYS